MALAARGARHLDDVHETITDTAVAEQLRRRARHLHLSAILSAMALTALLLALPE